VWSGTTQTKFSVDPEQAQKLIDGLTAARDRLEALYRESWQLRNAASPGKDMYSGFATLAIRKSAGDDEGGYGWANQKAQEALTHTMENIQKALDKYRGVDNSNQQPFKSGGSNS
jgi:hypothetical protein